MHRCRLASPPAPPHSNITAAPSSLIGISAPLQTPVPWWPRRRRSSRHRVRLHQQTSRQRAWRAAASSHRKRKQTSRQRAWRAAAASRGPYIHEDRLGGPRRLVTAVTWQPRCVLSARRMAPIAAEPRRSREAAAILTKKGETPLVTKAKTAKSQLATISG